MRGKAVRRAALLPSTIAAVGLLVALAACSDDDSGLPERLEEEVYAHEDYGMSSTVCAAADAPGGAGPDTAARSRRQGRRRLGALVRAVHFAPDASLTSRYITSDDGEVEQETTVRRWAKRELKVLRKHAAFKRADRCDRQAYAELRSGLRVRGEAFQLWSARETVRSYLAALAHGDERAACRRTTAPAAETDLDRLAINYRVPTISRKDTSPWVACLRVSERIAEAMTPLERRRFANRRLGPVTITARKACVRIGADEMPLLAGPYGSYRVDGLKPLAPATDPARERRGRLGYREC